MMTKKIWRHVDKLKLIRTIMIMNEKQERQKKEIIRQKSNKRKKYGYKKGEYPNKKFKENLSDETDEDSSSTIVPLNNIIIVIFSFYIYFVNFR